MTDKVNVRTHITQKEAQSTSLKISNQGLLLEFYSPLLHQVTVDTVMK